MNYYFKTDLTHFVRNTPNVEINLDVLDVMPSREAAADYSSCKAVSWP